MPEEKTGYSANPEFESVQTVELDTDIRLPNLDAVTGSGTWADPYTSPSGTAGLSEAIDKFGNNATIQYPKGFYLFTSAFDTLTEQLSLIGPSRSQRSIDPSTDGPISAFLVMDHDPGSPRSGGVIDQSSSSGDSKSGWHLENLHFVNKSGGTAAAIYTDWFSSFTFRNLTFGGPGFGFSRGMQLEHSYVFEIEGIDGQDNGRTVSIGSDVNEGAIRSVHGKPKDANEQAGNAAVMTVNPTEGGVAGSGLLRGVELSNITGSVGNGSYGIILYGARGIEINSPQLEHDGTGTAGILIADDGGGNNCKSVTVAGGYLHNWENYIRVNGGDDTEIDGVRFSGTDATGDTAVDIVSGARTNIRREVLESVDNRLDDGGTKTMDDGLIRSSKPINFPTVSAGGQVEANISTPGVEPGDTVSLGLPSGFDAGLTADAYVPEADKVTLRLLNVTSADINPPERTYEVVVEPL